MHVEAEFYHFGRTQVWQPKGLSAAEPACGGQLLAAEPCPRKWTFGSGRDFRPPKVPPNMHEFRLWREPSAAESAAEGA